MMMDLDLHIGVGAVTETFLEMHSDSMPDDLASDSEQDDLLGLNVDHNGPPSWVDYWPV